MLPASFLQDLIARIDLVEVVSRHVALRKAGSNYLGLCPFHGEKSPSFTVSPSKQFYHCFGCGAHGDAIRFLCEHAGLGFIDAVRELAQQAGLAMPENNETPAQRAEAERRREEQATLSSVLEKAARHYRVQLRQSPRAVEYLKGRGLTGEVAARFGLGYATDSWKGLASAFARYDDPLLATAGLVIVQGDDPADQRRYDRFRDRIMFPIRSVQGEVIGFGGRVLDRGEPKYLNSPETPVFSKGRELYGLFEARSAIRAKGCALVVEGYMDVVALAQHGIGHAVATLGTACTADHVQKLFRFTDSVVFSFDGDAAGRRAAQRALEASLPFATDARTIRFLFLPPEHDPDSFVRAHGTEAFEAALDAAVPLSRQLVEAARQGEAADTAEARAQMLARARPWMAALPGPLLRRQILGELAAEARLSVDELERQWSPQGPERTGPGIGQARDRVAERASDRSESRRAGPPSARRPLAPLATPLDRAASLVLRRCEWWTALGPDEHDLLADQPSPYGPFFRWIDRMLAEHGPLTPQALVEMVASDPDADSLGPLIERWRTLLDWEHTPDRPAELRRVVERLRLEAVEAELDLLLATPGLSDAARERSRRLLTDRADLKRRLQTNADEAPLR